MISIKRTNYKVQILYIFLPFVILGFRSSDKLTGRFYNLTTYEKLEFYDFQTTGKFEYYSECAYKKYGHGLFTIKDNKLILDYLTYESTEKGHFDIWKSSQHKDSVCLTIQDSQNNELLSDITIHYEGTQNGVLTNGNKPVKIARLDKDLIISKIGYRELRIPRDKILKNIWGFNVFLQNWSIDFKENTKEIITIKNLDTLVLDNCILVKGIKPKIIICE